MKLLAIVINYRTAEMTLDAVRSLLKALQHIPDSEVVVLDNDSQDGSFETLSGAIRGLDDRVPVTVLSSERNGGFAYGVNAGVRHGLSSTSPPEYFLPPQLRRVSRSAAVSELVPSSSECPGRVSWEATCTGSTGSPIRRVSFPFHVSELEQALRLGIASKLLHRWRVPMPIPKATSRSTGSPARDDDSAERLGRRRALRRRFFLYFEETDSAGAPVTMGGRRTT